MSPAFSLKPTQNKVFFNEIVALFESNYVFTCIFMCTSLFSLKSNLVPRLFPKVTLQRELYNCFYSVYYTISTLSFKSNLALFNLSYLSVYIIDFLNLYAPVRLFRPRVYQSVNVQLLDQVFI